MSRFDDESDLEGENLVGDERPRGDGSSDHFYQPGPATDRWGRRMHQNPHRSMVPDVESMVEGRDEQQWGQQRAVVLDLTAGTGIVSVAINQLVQATRPSRVWSIAFAFSLPNVSDLSTVHAPNGTLLITFRVQTGVGSTFIRQYIQLRDTDLVAFAPDPGFPLRVETPIASTLITSIPAKQILVDGVAQYNRILLAGPPIVRPLITCTVAPVYR